MTGLVLSFALALAPTAGADVAPIGKLRDPAAEAARRCAVSLRRPVDIAATARRQTRIASYDSAGKFMSTVPADQINKGAVVEACNPQLDLVRIRVAGEPHWVARSEIALRAADPRSPDPRSPDKPR